MIDKQSVLIVDDDPEFLKAMRKMFEKSGYSVALAGDGQEALDALAKDSFDLIISDVRMPHLNGIELMEEISRKRLDIPVIFITGYGEVESYMDLMNLGAYEYINKPVNSREILGIAKRAIEARGDSRRVSHI